MSNTDITYLIVAGAGVASFALWAWLIAVPAVRSYEGWWQRTAAVVMSLYVLVALLGFGGLAGAVFLWYYDQLG
jgi:hypothetical protein